jgi:hypothetical protein
MAVVINGTTGIDKVQDGSIGTVDIAADAITPAKIDNSVILGRRNILRNGAMRLNQRNGSGSKAVTTSVYSMDRIKHNVAGSTASRFSVQRKSTTPPPGHNFYYRRECTTAESIQSGTQSSFDDHRIESSDLTQLQWGDSSVSKSATLSFWIKGNVTGTYVVWFYAPEGGSTKMMTKTYTIDAVDTWEYKTITIPARDDVVMPNNTNAGLYVRFVWNTGTGSTSGTANSTWGADVTTNRYVGQGVNLASATGNYIEMTGTQLEAGDVATEFEHRTRSEYEIDCMRYYYSVEVNGGRCGFASGYFSSSTSIRWSVFTVVPMRTTPTYSESAVPRAADSGTLRNITSTSVLGFDRNMANLIGVTSSSSGASHSASITMSGDVSFALDAEL